MDDSTPGPAAGEATALLDRFARGDSAASGELYELLRSELHDMARRQMAKQSRAHTLQATALVNEAWMRLTRGGDAARNRGHFIAVAAKAMRSVLVDHERRRRRIKRGSGERPVFLQEARDPEAERAFDLIELDDALIRLALEEARLASIVELRFFAGLTITETADALGLGTATVERDWRLARIWLREELGAA